jgi:serine/threonine-protein kinase
MGTFFQELRQRRVYRVAIAYVVAASATVQVVGTVLPFFHTPDWIGQLLAVLLALGFPVALVLGWVFEISGGGVRRTATPSGNSSLDYPRITTLAITGLLVAGLMMSIYWWWQPWNASTRPPTADKLPLAGTAAAPSIPEKSIAVLPFANLSDEKENAFFTDGVQDEILTDLAKVADLKVISRTSVMQYRSGAERNLREIGEALGVAYVLEGSVQRDKNRVRVSAELIDARTDAHLWAERYDRNLSDLFALQSDLAETIVAQLKTKLSPAEKAAMEEPPTDNLAAHDLYIQANDLLAASAFNVQGTDNLFQAADLLQQAIVRAPDFFLAYCRLASVHDQIYLSGVDHTPARLALAEAAVQRARQLRPDAGQTHLALVEHLYCGYLDYDRARHELALARRALPNEPLVFELAAYLDRRGGHWEDSMQNFVRALELDPRNANTLQQLAVSYHYLRRYADEAAILDRALKILPNDPGLRMTRAAIALDARADPRPLHAVIAKILAKQPGAAAGLSDQWLYLALCEHDAMHAHRAIAAMTPLGYSNAGIFFPRAWCEALTAQSENRPDAARAAFVIAREQVAEALRDQPDYGESLCVLGMIDAALGRKEDALREGHRAVELLPLEKDSINGALAIEYLSVTCAWAGEIDQSVVQLQKAAAIPSDVTYGQLRLHPFWDSLRGDPRFETLVASLAPPQ